MSFNPEITQLITQAFGLSKLVDATGGYRNLEVIEEPWEAHRTTYLGTPILYPVIFKGQGYRYFKENGQVATKQLQDFELPAVTLSSFSRAKNISETELTAGYGSVDEMFGFQDYKIEIKGLCMAEKSHPHAKQAMDQLKRLREFESVGEAIPVVSDIYSLLGINAIVIKDLSLEQLAGRPGVIPFRITAKSSTPKELIL